LNRFKGHLKIYKWWNSHLVLMLVVIYHQLLLAKQTPPPGRFLATLALFLTASIGIAGFGQILNDAFDVEQDMRSGSDNLVARRSRKQIALKFGIVLLMALLPWLWLPCSPLILMLVGAEFALFCAYSIPPIRLKNRGLLGPAADALYAYPIPMGVSLLAFGQLGRVTLSPWMLAIVMAWSFTYGLHQIVIHQLRDAERDQLEGIQTFVTRSGWQPAFRFMVRLLLPLEMATFAVFLAAISVAAPLAPIGFVCFTAWMLYRWQILGIQPIINPWRLTQMDRWFVCNLTIMYRFNTEWLPLLILSDLIWRAPIYGLVLLLHLFLFQNGLASLLRFDLPEIRRLRRFA
jgi:4-hydroxybenzoate polyprenyltransferase